MRLPECSANWFATGRNSSKYDASVSNSRDATPPRKTPRASRALDERDTRLRNCSPERARARPLEVSRSRSDYCEQQGALRSPHTWTGKAVAAIAGSCRTGPLRGEGCDHSPRGGSEPLLQRRSTKLTARLTQRDEGQHKTPQGSRNPAKTQRRHARRANKAARRWPAATRRRAAPV